MTQEVVLSEARLSTGIVLASTPIVLAILVAIAEFYGDGLNVGIYHEAFGPLIYLVFFGGLAYAFFEFSKIVRGRTRYLTYQDGYLHILEQKPIKVADIRSVSIERKFLWKSLVIRTVGGTTNSIRGYLLEKNLREVKASVETLQGSPVPC